LHGSVVGRQAAKSEPQTAHGNRRWQENACLVCNDGNVAKELREVKDLVEFVDTAGA